LGTLISWLEQSERPGEAWRNHCWDSFTLNTPIGIAAWKQLIIDPTGMRALTAQRLGNATQDDTRTLPFLLSEVSDTGTPIIVPQATREFLEDKAQE